MSKAKCIMVQGTMSGAGKSLLCAALCRIFAQDGWRVAPFKSQNMALNSFVTRDGLEMGRAQVVQAQAAGVEPDVRMNPILLKPSSDIGSQVIVNGEVRGQMPAAEYFRRKKQLRLPERAVLWGQKVKYLLLAGLVALYVTRQEKLLTGASPWEVFSRLTALRLPPEGFGVGIGLLVLILLGMAVQPRFFCQFLCPMGAVFALLPVLPFARLHRQSESCIPGCNACKQQCPVCLKLEETSMRSGECIACEACVGTCPKQNIHRWDTALCKHQWLPVLGKALLFFLLGCWLGFCRFI